MPRKYKKHVSDMDDDIMTIKVWKNSLKLGVITTDDGQGYWMKDGKASSDEVFETPQLDATHVIWYNK